MAFPLESNILVVDDSAGSRGRVVIILNTLGYENTHEAENGSTALEKISELESSGIEVGLILADWNMPVMNGMEFFKLLKAEPKRSSIPFLMITAQNDSDLLVEAVLAGVADYIVKPFSDERLQEVMDSVWKRLQSAAKIKGA